MAEPVSFAPARAIGVAPKIGSGVGIERIIARRDTSLVGKALPVLVALATELGREMPVDYAKVAEIRAAIASGSYRIDPDRTAAALIAFGNGGRG